MGCPTQQSPHRESQPGMTIIGIGNSAQQRETTETMQKEKTTTTLTWEIQRDWERGVSLLLLHQLHELVPYQGQEIVPRKQHSHLSRRSGGNDARWRRAPTAALRTAPATPDAATMMDAAAGTPAGGMAERPRRRPRCPLIDRQKKRSGKKPKLKGKPVKRGHKACHLVLSTAMLTDDTCPKACTAHVHTCEAPPHH